MTPAQISRWFMTKITEKAHASFVTRLGGNECRCSSIETQYGLCQGKIGFKP